MHLVINFLIFVVLKIYHMTPSITSPKYRITNYRLYKKNGHTYIGEWHEFSVDCYSIKDLNEVRQTLTDRFQVENPECSIRVDLMYVTL